MNQVYKVVWNVTLGTWTAVSELAKGKTKSTSKKMSVVSTVGLLAVCALPVTTNAGQALLGGVANPLNSIAIGNDAGGSVGANIARGEGEITIGDGAQTGKDGVTSSQSIAIGFDAKAPGDQSIAVGANVRATGNSSIAIGGDDVDRLANDSAMNKKYQDLTDVKLEAKKYIKTAAEGGGATAVGTQATANGDFSTALGMTSAASGTASSALGVYAQASGGAALAIGAISKAEADQSIALGTNSKVDSKATNSIAIGNGATASNKDSIAIGSGSNANSQTLANQAYLVGGVATSEMNIGDRRITGVSAGSDDTDAVNVSQLRQVALETSKGFALTAEDGNSVQKNLGQAVEIVGADANISTKVADGKVQIELNKNLDLGSAGQVNLGNTILNNAGLVITNTDPKKVVSITNSGINAGSQTIANVAAGVTTTDAVNKGQLDAVDQKITSVLEQKIEAVDKERSFRLSSNGQKTALIAGNATIDIGVQNVNDRNLTAAKNGDTIGFALNQNLSLKTVQTGDTVIDADGLSFKKQKTQTVTVNGNSTTELVFDENGNPVFEEMVNTPKIKATGIHAGDLKITNVADGELSSTSKDAVNGSQLYQVMQNIEAVQGNVTAAQNLAKEAQELASQGFALTAQDEKTVKKNLGQAIEIVGADANISTKVANDQVQIELAKDITVDSVKAGDTTVNNDGVVIQNGPSITKQGVDAANLKVTNVANGEVSSTSKDAINGSQLYNTVGADAYDANGNLTNIGGTGANNINDAIKAVNKNMALQKVSVQAGSDNVKVTTNETQTVYTVDISQDITVNSVNANTVEAETVNAKTVQADTLKAGNTTVNNAGLTIQNGPSVTNTGINAGDKKVTAVANGQVNATSKDAVNGSQLNATNQAVVQYLGGGAGYDNITQSFNAPTYQVNNQQYNDVGSALNALDSADAALNQRVDNLGDQLQQAFYDSNKRIDDVEKRANAGIAAAMALETAPYIAGKYTYAAGAAYHGGENAFGVTLRKTADNGRWSLTGGVAAGSVGSPSVRVGISGVID